MRGAWEFGVEVKRQGWLSAIHVALLWETASHILQFFKKVSGEALIGSAFHPSSRSGFILHHPSNQHTSKTTTKLPRPPFQC